MAKWYKVVGTGFGPLHGGKGKWFAPKGSKPGKWMPKIANVKACNRGYHLIPAKAIVEWLPPSPHAGYLCEAEGRGASDSDNDKTAFAEARLLKIVGLLDEKSMRLAAADMAKRVLPIFYKVRPKDDRPALAIQAARDFAHGKIDVAAAVDAAWAAAWAAAGGAAGGAARDAAWDAAWDAAGGAAGAAARGAAVDAAWAAAVDAAGAAAWAAARDAARGATGAAAWAAARAANNAKIIVAQARARLKEVE